MKLLLRILYIVSFVSLRCVSNAQNNDTVNIEFKVLFNNQLLQLDSTFFLSNQNNDSIVFANFKFYISNIKLINNNRLVYQENNSHHLVNYKQIETAKLSLPIIHPIDYDAVEFDLGIDSLTNSRGIGSNDLDPLRGMYWSWHSGYINLKLEGRSSLCKTRNNAFEFHLGGFLNGFCSLQTIRLNVNNKKNIIIDIAVDKFIDNVNLNNVNHIMTPSKEAVFLSKIAATIFSINQ